MQDTQWDGAEIAGAVLTFAGIGVALWLWWPIMLPLLGFALLAMIFRK